jgi:hypothetical protein
MFRKALISISLLILGVSNTLAVTDPEPNPFSDLEKGEKVFEATVVDVSDDILTVENGSKEEFSGKFDQIFKYRDGGGPAAANEFFVDDKIRVMVDESGVIRAAQDYELLLCDQNFYGWVKSPTESEFELKTVERDKYKIHVGDTTQYRDEDRELLLGYSPREDDIVRVHGVVNTNVNEVFTETFGAYISLLDEEALAPILAEIEEYLLEPQFDDVDAEHEFFEAIQFIEYEGIVDGYDDGTYKPDNPINRAEFTKILIGSRFADELSEEVSEKCFPDFEIGQWFAPYVCLAKEKEILQGYPDGSFGPGKQVNLAEALKIILVSFDIDTDSAKPSQEWYVPYFEKAQELEILPENFGEAGDELSRGQMAELIMRTMNL